MNTDLLRLSVATLADRWWMPVVRGVVAILFGVVALFMPGISLLALVVLWGAYALVDGVVNVAHAFKRARGGTSWGWLLFEGLVSVAAGVVTFLWPGITALALLVVIAVWAVITGVAEIAAAIRLRKQITDEWLLGLSGALSIAFGVILLLRPQAGAVALVWLIGAYAIAFGALLIGLGMRLYRWHRGAERQLPTGGVPTPV
jgi:uncharacterized membrane protein HdeD (DUF308 family)